MPRSQYQVANSAAVTTKAAQVSRRQALEKYRVKTRLNLNSQQKVRTAYKNKILYGSVSVGQNTLKRKYYHCGNWKISRGQTKESYRGSRLLLLNCCCSAVAPSHRTYILYAVVENKTIHIAFPFVLCAGIFLPFVLLRACSSCLFPLIEHACKRFLLHLLLIAQQPFWSPLRHLRFVKNSELFLSFSSLSFFRSYFLARPCVAVLAYNTRYVGISVASPTININSLRSFSLLFLPCLAACDHRNRISPACGIRTDTGCTAIVG